MFWKEFARCRTVAVARPKLPANKSNRSLTEESGFAFAIDCGNCRLVDGESAAKRLLRPSEGSSSSEPEVVVAVAAAFSSSIDTEQSCRNCSD